jgi:hypothetical protein
MLPSYHATLQFTQQRDTSGTDLAWIRAALSNPVFGRMFAQGLPSAVLGIFPEPVRPAVTQLAQAFGASPAAELAHPA